MVPPEINDSAWGEAVVRHLSADGCQLVLGRLKTAPGQRFRFHLAGFATVFGTVRWTVADRAGFVFDRPLCGNGQHILTGHGAAMRGLELFLA